MRDRLASTVFGLTNNAAAVSRLVTPVAASSATRCSEGVRSPRVRCRWPDSVLHVHVPPAIDITGFRRTTVLAEQGEGTLARQCIHTALDSVLHFPVLLFDIPVVVGTLRIVIQLHGRHQPSADFGRQWELR
jgi:hypothetical protein